MIKKIHSTKGYTLIELIIVMVLLVVTGTLVVGIISSTLRGSNKTKLTNDLAQNGNYALSLITNLLVNSQRMVSFTQLGGAIIPDCTASVTSGAPIVGQAVTVLGFDGGTTTLTCDGNTISSSSAIFSNSIPTPTPYAKVSILDTSQVQIVSSSCSFACSQVDTYSPPRIDVSFQLSKANLIANTAAPIVKFNTSVSLRNQNYR